ncbi:SEL1-like repeat protein [Dongia sp. agr-C8]
MNFTVLIAAAALTLGTLTSPACAGPWEDAVAAYERFNFPEAFRLALPLAEQGDVRAEEMLTSMYQRGDGVPQSDDEAMKWRRRAAEHGSLQSQKMMGFINNGLFGPPNYSEAARWWRMAAEQGDSGGQLALGDFYAHGKGVPLDYAEAHKWLTLAANQGSPGAQNELGDLAAQGKGTDQSYHAAAKWYFLAAKRGHFDAEVNLAKLYEDGNGVAQDPLQAHAWYNLAALTAGNKDERAIAVRARGSLATRMTMSQIIQAQQLASQMRKDLAIDDTMGLMVERFHKSADNGDATAQFALGQGYEDGQYVLQDYPEAAQWYRRSADQGYAPAQLSLGRMIQDGRGTAVDPVEAYVWLSIAANARDMEIQMAARTARDALAKQLTPDQLTNAQARSSSWRPKSVPQ